MRRHNSPSSQKENVIEAELVRRVEAAGGVCPKVTVIGRRGFFDRLAVLPGGRVVFVEVKRPRGGRMTPHQKQYHAVYEALGAAVAVVKDVRDIDAILTATTV